MCMEISAITERWKLREGVSEKHSACLTSRLRPEQWNGAERADGRAEGTDWHQAREKSPWDRTNRDAMTRDYITTCSGQTDKSSLLVLWILPATGDNDIKYKLVFKLFKSGNCTWFACPTEELYVSKFWAVGFFFFFLLFFEHWVFRCNVCEARHNSWRWGDMGLILELREFHVVFWEKLTSFYYGIQVIMKNGKTIDKKIWEVKPWVCHVLAVWMWASHWISLTPVKNEVRAIFIIESGLNGVNAWFQKK